ncbi:interferon-induced very large GTPase 1-like [Pseudorasbora parva]|uniref:interferon-induced very large GTPase 1-like n=1 Tax=Pseudorasbora parva TaxID=51549 RepID=UPI00351ED09E
MDPEGVPRPCKDLETELKAFGLDGSFWTKVFKDELEVTDIKQLEYLDNEDFESLKKHTRYKWEKKALQNILGHFETAKSEAVAKEVEKSPSMEKPVLAEHLPNLDNMTQNLAKELESTLTDDFEERRTIRMINERPLKDYFDSLKTRLSTNNDSQCLPPMSISDKEILNTASGGLALQGIFKTGKVEDLLKDRQQLIRIDDFKLAGPRHTSHYMRYEFSSSKSHQEFLGSVEKLGYSYSVELNLGCLGVHPKFGLQNTSQSSRTSQSQSEQSYVAMTVFHYMPLALAFIDQLTLSDSAKKELIEINELLHAPGEEENHFLLKRVKRFFERFGSHVSQGPIHFGGMFWWNAYAQGFSEQNYDKVKSQLCNALALNCPVQSSKIISASNDISISKGKMDSQIRCNDNLNTVVQLSVHKSGGPAETDDHILWKNNLAANNKTWAVIDRGSTLTPVWEIIRTSHNDQFKDPLRLCTFLIRAYKEISQQDVEPADDVKALRIVSEAKQLMLSVDKWSLSDAEKHLRDLLRMRRQIKECTTSFTQWIDIILSNEALQKFLTKLTTTYTDDNIRFLTYLVMETHCYQVKKFPNRAQILEWVKGTPELAEDVYGMFTPIQQFSDVTTVLEKASEDFLQSSEEDINVTITCKVTHAINSWLETMKKNGLDDLVLLVLSVTKHVGHRKDTFHPLLGSQEIAFLIEELSDVHRKYMEFHKDSILKAQAFSLLTLLTAGHKSHELSVDKKKTLDAFKQTMKEDNSDLKNAIEDFTKHLKYELLEEQLRSMLYSTSKLEGHVQSTEISENKEAADTSNTEDAVKTAPVDGFPKLNIGLVNPYKELLERLDLLKYYPAKLSNSNLHTINMLSTCITQTFTEKELWIHFIYRLLTLDVHVRFLCIEPELQISSKSLPCSLESFFDFKVENVDSNANGDQIHPMDIYMAVYHCSNDFARQFIFTQLSKCHFAVPLLVPNLSTRQIELPVWPLQMSALTLQVTEQSPVTGSVLDTSYPVVSFMRLGSSINSKSKMMNDMINKNGHPTFFSRHCRGSTTTRVLLEGVAEISWYLPEGKKRDIFESCMAFINLHGDACKLPQQVQFLKRISSIIVLLLPENLSDSAIQEVIKHFLECSTPFIALFSGIETPDKRDSNRIAAKNRNEAELTQETLFKIKQLLSNGNRNQILKDIFEQGRQQGFIVETEAELKGREKAKVLMDILYVEKKAKEKETNRKSLGLKDVHLPLQDQLWMQWCTKDKEFHRIRCKKNMSIEQLRAEITEEKMKIRANQQRRSSENLFMEKFLQYTIDVENKESLYFLNCFKKSLDEYLRGNLVDLTKQYNRTWLTYREASAGEKGKYQTDLCALSERIKHATFGLHHVFREISQIYESHKSVEESKTIHEIELDKLPEMGADLMLSGHPLELMDGDVNYVAIDWVRAVLDKLIHKLGDKRVLVLSVVGLQSSGKSTLLNTMFGLDFAVSSGPCTRGAFMHLLPVEEQIRDELKFDYVLVVDTEGLRSTVTDPDVVVKNDNELATLIIGISDLALINVMGENLCEIQNILQVCFQALLRMKNVNIRPSCMFVHQNVSDITAKDKNQGGRIQLIEKLDEISRAAAEEENQVVVGFSDIIKFDVNSDVYYFKNLLEGDPPMAPPNPSYSQNVQELKKRVLSISSGQSNSTLLTLSEFSERIKDTWSALLNENFVFNFRNSLDMKVYSDLERDYQRWSWKLRKLALETQRTLNCRVKSCELNTINESEIKGIFEDTHTTIKTDVDTYFREMNHSDILSQWRVLIDRRLDILKEELTEETYKKGQKEVIQRNLKLELDRKLRKYETELFQKGMAAASALKNQTPNEDLIQMEFDKLWIQWTTDLSSKNPMDTETNIQSLVESALLNRFEKHKDVICNKSEEDFQFDTGKHIKRSRFTPNFGINNSQMNQTGNDISKQILQDISKRIKEKAADGNDVTENFIHEILEDIDEMTLNYQKSYGFQFTSLYKACLSAYVCRVSTRELKKIKENFRSENDPLTHLMKKKQHFFQLFKRYCQGAESVKTFVSVLINSLQEAMRCALSEKLSIDIADYLRHHHEALRGNKSDLEHRIMKHLAEKENFEEYIKYIHNPKSFCREFIRECVVKHINDEQMMVSEALSSSWSQLTEKVMVECSSASEKMREAQGNASMWLDEFCLRLGQEISLSREDFRTIENLPIDNAQILQETVASSLKDMLEKGQKDPKSILGSGPIIFKLKDKPVDVLFEQLSGCWEQCPFCKAVCTNTIANHGTDHTVEWHRCQAIGGLFHQKRFLDHLKNIWDKDADKEHFVLDFCSTSVISDIEFKRPNSEEWISFKQFKKAGSPYNSWKITPDNQDRLYWKWFICTFSEQLENLYNFKFAGHGKIPETWKRIKKDKVIKEMNDIIQTKNEYWLKNFQICWKSP